MSSISTLLSVPLRMARVEFIFEKPVRFPHFYHGNVIRGILLNLLKSNEREDRHRLSPGIVPVVLENGHLSYQPGDHYVFGLVFIGTDISLAEKFRVRLSSYISRKQGILQLGHNIQLYEYQLLDEVSLLEILSRLKKNKQNTFTIRLLTPLTIDREKEDRCDGHTRYDQQLFRVEIFLKKIIHRLNNLIHQNVLSLDPIDIQNLPPLELQLKERHLVWIELPTNKYTNTYGGVVGNLKIEGTLDEFWSLALVLGSFMHIGEKINFGFGFYDLPELFPDISQLFKPAQNLLDSVIREKNLLDAFMETKQNSKLMGVDGVSITEIEEDYSVWKEKLQRELREQKYTPAPLMGIVLRDKQKVRALAVPSIIDRWLQRAVLNIIAPIIEVLLEDCSFAYRRNLSRQQARAAISDAYREGYRYVVESDIENFFDEVEWEILTAKLKALFPFEPIIDLIEQWIKAPVMFNQNLIIRKKGLPQGAVISPLLSNLYLDEFDENIQRIGFKLVRFADDFVILCKSKKQAEQALKAARQTLKKIDLEIKDAKTRITHFDEGFRYLGYLFCRSVVLETLKAKDDREFDWALLDESKIPPNSWLANARFNGQTLEDFLQEKRQKLFRLLFHKKDNNCVPLKKTVYLGNYQVKIKIKNNQLQVIQNNNDEKIIINRIPLETIRQLVLLGPVPLTMPALWKLIRKKIPILLANAQSIPQASINHLPPDLNLWIKQGQLFNRSDFQIAFCRSIVMAKIHNYLKSFYLVDWPEREAFISQLSSLKTSCLNKNSIAAIRGIEGRAAAVFYGNFSKMLGEEWGFRQRRKHPAPDAINALLSLGYTILYAYLTGLILGQGLNPQMGIYHQSQIGFNALSSDLQEEFRFLIDRLILTMVNRRQIFPEQIKQMEKSGKIFLLSKAIKNIFIKELESKLHQCIFWRLTKQKMSYLEIMEFQVHQLKEIILNKRFEYQPFLRR